MVMGGIKKQNDSWGVVVVLTSIRTIKPAWSQDRLQPLWSGGIPQGKHRIKPKVVHAYITAGAFHASVRKIEKYEIGSQPTYDDVPGPYTGTYGVYACYDGGVEVYLILAIYRYIFV